MECRVMQGSLRHFPYSAADTVLLFSLPESTSTVKKMVQNDADTFARLEHDLTTCHGF